MQTGVGKFRSCRIRMCQVCKLRMRILTAQGLAMRYVVYIRQLQHVASLMHFSVYFYSLIPSLAKLIGWHRAYCPKAIADCILQLTVCHSCHKQI